MSDNNQNVLVDRPLVPIDSKYFIKVVSGIAFPHHYFKNCGAKEATFTDIDFSFSIFEKTYFHECKFINCKFTGARIVESNFRGSTFDNCEFNYVTIRQTLISHVEVLANCPSWPNVKREMMRSFRINADSVGDVEASKAFVREELAASREHLRKAREAKEPYYAKKYSGFKKRLNVHWDSFWSFMDWHLWGHGEYPHKLAIAVVAFLLLTAFILFVQALSLNPNISVANVGGVFQDTLRDTGYSFLGIKASSVSDGWAAALALLRYLSFSLFMTVLYKRLVRR